MAVEHASELASLVASYLRKHGFAKTLTAFLREIGGTVQEMDMVDLETLYKLHISTQANGTSKTKKLKKAKLEEGHEITKGYEDVRDNAEVKALANLHVNGGTPSERKKKKKGEKENVAADTPLVPEVDQTDVKKAEDKLTPTEKKESKKKRKEEELEKADVITEGLKPLGEKFLSETTGIPGTLRHSAQEVLSNGKKSKKEKKEQGSEQPSGNVLEETRPVDIIPQVLSKKKKKKTKDIGKEETTDTSKPVSEVPISVQTEKVDATKPPVELSCDLEGCETGSKKKKQRKDLSSGGDANGRLQEPFDASMEATKNNEDTDSKKQSGKKRKIKEATTLVNEVSNQEYDNLNLSPDKTKESREDEGVNDRNVEMHKSGSAKTENQKETPNNKKTPTGAMAFKRVEVEKVSFSDPRLGDNSYWAKDGAEEGYGAKAQEVLGFVRGRDFRHEKTKKKRGSYRGGLIGLQSHSIKFENSDED